MENVIMLKMSKFEELSSKIRMIRYYNLTSVFEVFESDQILQALLEYSKFPRDYTNSQRLLYLYEKCMEQLSIVERENIPDGLGCFESDEDEYLPF